MDVNTPKLLVDLLIVERNISSIISKLEDNVNKFRPHFKTHQSAHIGEIFKKFGVNKICVSSLNMAEYFADAGWNDITIGIPVNINELERIEDLSKKITLNLVVENIESIHSINQIEGLQNNIFIKIDTGYHRTGLLYDNFNEIESLVNEIGNSDSMAFAGFFSHFGNTYDANSVDEIVDIYSSSVSKLLNLKNRFVESFPNIEVSIGDTPSVSLINNFSEVDEIRPGNFVFYDVMQYYLGACSLDQIAINLACTVLAKHQERLEIVVHGGAVHLSKDYCKNSKGDVIYGLLSIINNQGWNILPESNYVKSVSQEHGILKLDLEHFEKIKIGDILGILPVHSCLTANLAKNYLSTDGDIVGKM